MIQICNFSPENISIQIDKYETINDMDCPGHYLRFIFLQ